MGAAGRRGVTADTALRLARLFDTSPQLWLGLQVEYDLRQPGERSDSVDSHILPLVASMNRRTLPRLPE
jgi:plasmid maintenance system antidote protein VapI